MEWVVEGLGESWYGVEIRGWADVKLYVAESDLEWKTS